MGRTHPNEYDPDMGYLNKCPDCGSYYYDSDGACSGCYDCEACGKTMLVGKGIEIGGDIYCADCAADVYDQPSV